MKWFAHESNASSDSKIKKLILSYGAEGYAVYFHCLELIASEINENHINFELEHDSEIIADNLKIKGTGTQSGRDRVEEIMRKIIDLNLFQEDQGKIFCLQLARRVSSAQIKNENLKSIQLAIEQRLTESSKNFLENSNKFRLPTNNTNQQYQQDQDNQEPPQKSAKAVKHKHGQFQNVLLTDDELYRLETEYGKDKTNDAIEFYSEWSKRKGRSDKEHNLALRKWVFKAVEEEKSKSNSVKGDRVGLGGSDKDKDYSVPEEYRKDASWMNQ